MSLISQLFGSETLDPFLSVINQCPVLSTPTDWKETPNAHVLVSDLPGLKKEEVKVEVDDGRVLQISGERKVEEENGGERKVEEENGGERKVEEENGGTDKSHPEHKWHRVERCRGKFLRRFKLPENAKIDEIQASMENGVLTVTIPKQEVPKPQRKVIEIEAH